MNNKKAARAAMLLLLATGLNADAQAASNSPASKRLVQQQAETYADRAEVAAFADEMSARGLDPVWIQRTLSEARKLESVRRAIKPLPSGQRKNWQTYRDRFVNAGRTQAGKQFLQQHADTLMRASQQYGVPVEVIVGIVGVETFYGRDTGRYRVVDALATLAFDYPAEDGKDRSPYFREQLAQFFLWCGKEQCDPLGVKGSYAGAIGMPQFMPENILRYGTDFNGDGRINLHDPVDAIGSVARFLALHGWVRQLAPTASVDLVNAQLEPLLVPDIIPSFTQPQLFYFGAKPRTPLSMWEKYALIELQNGDAENEYVLGSRNFYVLTRYNRSSYYAMAVLALGQEVVAAESAAANEPDSKVDVAAGRPPAECSQC